MREVVGGRDAPHDIDGAMDGELRAIFAQGDAELRSTAGEDGVLVRRCDGERVCVRVVVSVAEVAYQLKTATGASVTCDRVALISRDEAGRAPVVGDILEVGDLVYELVSVTGWAYDTSWHADLTIRRGGRYR